MLARAIVAQPCFGTCVGRKGEGAAVGATLGAMGLFLAARDCVSSAWKQVFPDRAMTVAAIDRLVHHATVLELSVESYRRRAAVTWQHLRDDASAGDSDNLNDNNPKGGDYPNTS